MPLHPGTTLGPYSSPDQVTPVLIAGTDGGAREPFFFADGLSIGFYTRTSNQLQKVFTSGGVPVTLGNVGAPYGASWGADDVILFGQGANGVWRVPGTGGTPEPVITLEDGEQAYGPQMLPGEWVLFTLLPGGVTSWDEAHVVMQCWQPASGWCCLKGDGMRGMWRPDI